MKFRKAITLLTAAVMSLSLLAACGPADEVPPNTEKPPVAELPDKTVESTKLTVYDGPNLLESSSQLSAFVEDTELFVYDTRVNHNRIFSWAAPATQGQVVLFDFEGKVHMKVEITGAQSLTDVVVRPLSYEVEPTVNGNVVEFDLEYCANYTLEYNDGKVEDGADNALHIFANPIEEDPVDPENLPDNVIYVGPGVYSAGAIPMQSNTTLYLAGGAYVYGQVRAENLENIAIRGRGIFSGSIYSRTKDSEYTLPIELRYCKNVTIEGIALLDPAGWAVTLYNCENVAIDNLKIITARSNGDGISVQSCKNVTVTGGFVRTWDDSLVVKNVDRGTTSGITFDNVTVWTDLAQSCEVGYETYGATMDNITFKNITILHNYHKAAMSIHNCDDAEITNVTYQSITIEDASMLGDNQVDGQNDFLIDISIAYNVEWTKSGGERGKIDGVTFENIKILSVADTIISRISGESANSSVNNVQIVGVEIEGQAIENATQLGLSVGAFVNNVTVGKSGYDVFGASVALPYQLDLKESAVAKTVVPSRTQQGLEVPAFSIMEVSETYMGVKFDLSDVSVSATHGTGTTANAAYDDGSGDFGDATVENLVDGDRATAYEAKSWTGQTNEFAAISFDFGETVAPGVIRVYLAEENAYVYDFNISIFIQKTESANFVRSLNISTYTATPATGNYFDIKLPATLECTALQLRIFRVDGMTGQERLKINEVAFYPSSLSTTKAIVDSTPHYDVYPAGNLVDGNESTYWEAETQEAFFTVDLGRAYDVRYLVMHLPPLMTWPEKVQKIAVLMSEDNVNWTTVVAEKEYTFDPAKGNSNVVELTTPVRARYVKLVFSYNSSGYGAQLSELYVYGE